MPASGCSSANISVDSLVPLIIHVIQNVLEYVDNAVVTDNARSHAGNPALHVWSHASGVVLTTRVRWCAARYVRDEFLGFFTEFMLVDLFSLAL